MVTLTFRTLYVFVILEVSSRRVLHDRDSIFSPELDRRAALGVRVLRRPARAPHANAICERFGACGGNAWTI